jgi:DNA-directed RNA polymerase subunit beta
MTFERSNHDMIVHQWARVTPVRRSWARSDILADGQSIDNGELAVGRNLRVAYMPWEGYNYEDAIIISEKVMQPRLLYISPYQWIYHGCSWDQTWPWADNQRYPECIDNKARDLDVDGIVRTGAYVRAGDILVGKVTPKGEMELSPEESLLRAIFGDKSKDVKDSSLVMPIWIRW